jgi:dihydroorotate dehydrogenase (NAD+) catalytic subunit
VRTSFPGAASQSESHSRSLTVSGLEGRVEGRFLDSRGRLPPVTSAEPVQAPERPAQADLSVRVGDVALRNPIIAASGTFGYGVEFAHLVDLNALGGIVVKGLSAQPMPGAPPPRLCETPSGMVNAVGLQNIGVRAFVAEKLPVLRRYNTAVIANVFGHSIPDYLAVIRILDDAEGIAAYELNVSCPNVERGGSEFGTHPSQLEAVVSATRARTKRRLWVKLAPTVGSIQLMARIAETCGADALTIANTYPALCIDVHTQKSRLASTFAGLSGPAIKPITLRLVYEACRVVKIPVIGLGGIAKPEDVMEYMLAGATAVEVGTAHFVDPRASEKLVSGFRRLCYESKISEISDLRGNLRA